MNELIRDDFTQNGVLPRCFNNYYTTVTFDIRMAEMFPFLATLWV